MNFVRSADASPILSVAAAGRGGTSRQERLMVERYDNLVIGGGMSGLPLALRAARYGRTAFVERELLGGTCLNRGCIPTKTMIASAQLAHDVRRASDLGVHAGAVTVDLKAVVARKDDIVESIRSGSYRAVGWSGGLEFIEEHGRFVSGRRLQLGDRTIEADRIFLNTGTRDAIPSVDGLDQVDYLTSPTILDLRQLPEHLIVVGGGFIGCEFAQMFARFGAKGPVVQRGDRLLPPEDPDISRVVEEAFTAEGIDVLTATTCVALAQDGDRIRVACEGAQADELVGSHLLIATGRTPNTDDLGLEHLGVDPEVLGSSPSTTASTPTPRTSGRSVASAATTCSPTPPATTPTPSTDTCSRTRTGPSPTG